jgi:cysteine dioxygenase
LTVVQGELRCCNYRFVRPEGNEKRTLPGSGYEEHFRRLVEVERLDGATFEADGRVAVVDRQQTTHRIENLEKSRYGSVSLHVYSKPIDSCVLFDEASRCCERRRLQYYSANGVVLENVPLREPQLTTAAA